MRNFDVIEIIKKQIVKGIKDNVFYLSTINLERKTININIYHSKKNQNSDFYTNIAQTIGMSKQDNIKLFAEKLAKYLNKNKKIFINVYADKINMIHFKINHTYFFKYLLNFNNTIFKKESKLLNFKMYNISCPSFLPVQEFDIDDLNGILISNSIINILKYYGIRSDSEMFIYNEPKACAKISEETTAVYKSLFQTKTNLFPSKIEFEIAS
jgi:arginyl-tRNA synthetase